jgi:hypothetical protein
LPTQSRYDLDISNPEEKHILDSLGQFDMLLTWKAREKMLKDGFARRITPEIDTTTRGIFPNDEGHHWTLDNFGPLWVPKKGGTTQLTPLIYPIYERIIRTTDSELTDHQSEKVPKKRYDTSLHKVVYYNKLTKKLIGTNTKEIQSALIRLERELITVISFKDNNRDNSKLTLAINNIVYYVITEISYFFKSADYSFENEERVILYMPPYSPLVKIEERTILPKRLYVESKNPFRKHVRKVILGPRVAHPDRWTYLKAKMIKNNFKIELVPSICKFQ